MRQNLLRKVPFGSLLVTAIVTLTAPYTIAASGGNNGGGGNTLNGKPIESYVGDVTAYASYKKMIAPMLENLDRKVPNFSDEMRKTVTDKTWYFVPTKLNQLPTRITGIQFDSDQIIIQLEKSVWVDKIRFAALKENEQGTLLLHELVMGVVMKYRQNQITENDSDLVRTTTIYLLSHPNDSAQVVKSKLHDVEYFYPTAYDWLLHGNDFIGRLYTILQNLKADQTLPNEHAYFGGMSKALETICVTQFKNEPSQGTLTVSTFYRELGQGAGTISEGTPSDITISGRPNVSFFDSAFGAGHFPNINYTFIENKADAKDGEIRKVLSIVKGGSVDEIDGLYMTYQICRDALSSGKCEWASPSAKELKSQNLSQDDERTCESHSFSKQNLD